MHCSDLVSTGQYLSHADRCGVAGTNEPASSAQRQGEMQPQGRPAGADAAEKKTGTFVFVFVFVFHVFVRPCGHSSFRTNETRHMAEIHEVKHTAEIHTRNKTHGRDKE